MESKLLRRWLAEGRRIEDFEFFTNRPNLVIGKLPDEQAEVEYVCPHCSFYEIKTIQLTYTKSGKLGRPRFACSGCGKTIRVPSLRRR